MDCSVVVCTRNRANQLSEALFSLTKLHVPRGTIWEVVVVDNGSTDSTVDVIRSFKRDLADKACLSAGARPIKRQKSRRRFRERKTHYLDG